jgi:ABC-type lipoprotein release transport system permease subunit
MTSSAMTAMSVALVVMVLTILLGFVHGMRRTMTDASESANWMVLERGVLVETGGINHENYQILRTRSEIASDRAGSPLISPEILVGFDPTPDASRASTAMIRAVYSIAYEVHRNIRIVEGHRPERGKNQWKVGQRLAARYPNLRVGEKFIWGRNRTEWQIVGVFSDKGSARESEVWANLDDLAELFHVPASELGASAIHIVLKPGSADAFAELMRTDSRLRTDLMSERAFYAQAAGFSNQLRSLGLVVAAILSIGAIFGAMNTMYSAVARRKREVGTLRVLGFGRGSVLTAFMLESAILAILGGLIGEMLAVIVAYASGLESRLMNVGTILFSFRLPWSAFAIGLGAALVIGITGGMLPAWQAARLDVIDSLRE